MTIIYTVIYYENDDSAKIMMYKNFLSFEEAKIAAKEKKGELWEFKDKPFSHKDEVPWVRGQRIQFT